MLCLAASVLFNRQDHDKQPTFYTRWRTVSKLADNIFFPPFRICWQFNGSVVSCCGMAVSCHVVGWLSCHVVGWQCHVVGCSVMLWDGDVFVLHAIHDRSHQKSFAIVLFSAEATAGIAEIFV